MACITIPLEESDNLLIDRISWVNWSSIARHEALKKEIFEKFMKKQKMTKEEQDFCESIDWHPVDELPVKESYIKELKKIKKGKYVNKMTPIEFKKWLDDL